MTEELTVAVNLLWLAPGRVGGSEQYLVRQLARIGEAGIRPTIYARPSFVEVYPELRKRYDLVELPTDVDSRALRIAAEHSWLAMKVRDADLVHHGGGTIPMAARHPAVLTIHDLQYLRFPQYFGRGRRAYLHSMMPRSVRSAEVVCTPTRYVRDTVIDAFGADPDRVVVVPHGMPRADPPTPGDITEAKERHRVPDTPYVVYPAITHPHKRHRVLVDALMHLDLHLVLLGGVGPAEGELGRAIASAGMAARVTRTGRVTSADRDALVAGAAVLAFPSEYEGFGAPLVEAMALDVPVVCGDHPAIREVVGEAAIIVADDDGAAWAEAISEAVERRDELVELGRGRRSAFTVTASAAALADAYRMAVAT